MSPIACNCSVCRAMCEGSTCLPTPEGARALIRAGLGDRLASYAFHTDQGLQRFIGPAPAGMEGGRELPDTRRGRCTFKTAEGCELHAGGLKPQEGQLAHHDRHWLPIRMEVCRTWRGRQFDSVMAALDRNTEAASTQCH